MRWLAWMIAGAVLCSGCKESKPSDSKPAEAPLELNTKSSTIAKRPGFNSLAANVMERLAQEAGDRPADAPHIEELLAKLRAQNLEMKEPQQSLGATMGARYCAGTMSNNGVSFSMCEFTDEARAAAAKARTEKEFAAVPNRTVLTHKKALMVLRVFEKTEKSEHDAALITELFNQL